jgi:hypothetical protein
LIKRALALPALPGFTPRFKYYVILASMMVAAGVALAVVYGNK